ncbi:MAG: hypothetical protein JWO91_3207 [Acidobacteriaceae bacterium]|jgi:hypothetical protein|nr:hypothetical protein [Acidobacteriaceae bacterium]
MSNLYLAILVIALSISALGQGTTQPTQPTDPTAQTPTGPIPSTPPTFPAPEVKGGAPDTRPSDSTPTTSDSSSGKEAKARPFMGTVLHSQTGYVLRSGDLEFKLDDQEHAKVYEGKNVKVTGSLDKKNNTIHVQTIELSPMS